VYYDSRPFELKIMIHLGPMSNLFSKRNRVVISAVPPSEVQRERHKEKRRAEMCRRSKVKDWIATLPLDRQRAAEVVEETRQAEYNMEHQTCVYCHPPIS
jgi:hypothetical protein